MKNQEKHEKHKVQPFFHIQVVDYYAPDYWLHLKVNSNTSLGTLDQFLRNIWLECCGHLSAFSHKRERLGKGRKLKDVLEPGMVLL